MITGLSGMRICQDSGNYILYLVDIPFLLPLLTVRRQTLLWRESRVHSVKPREHRLLSDTFLTGRVITLVDNRSI